MALCSRCDKEFPGLSALRAHFAEQHISKPTPASDLVRSEKLHADGMRRMKRSYRVKPFKEKLRQLIDRRLIAGSHKTEIIAALRCIADDMDTPGR